MVEIKNKTLANLIKADLWDALTNDRRWKREGVEFFFSDYAKWAEEEIWIHTDNEELKKELAKNRLRNWDRRLAKLEQKKEEYVKRYGKTYQEGELYRIEKQNKLVLKDELESQDWQEIVNLMDQIVPIKEQKDQAKKAELDAKLASQPGLFYWAGRGKRSYGTDDEGRGWYHFTIIKNGQEYLIDVPKEHSALTNFPFDTEGFHIISGIDHLPIAKKRSYWWNKRVGLNDKITIIPYEVRNNDELPENLEKELEPKGKNGCDTCHKKLGKDWGGSDNFYVIKRYHGQVNIGDPVIWACRDCYPTKEQEYLQNYETVWERYLDKNNEIDYRQIKFSFIDCYASHKDPNGNILQQQNCSHCQPWKLNQNSNLNVSESDLQALIQYLQKNSIKEINFKNNELVITHNNNNNNNNNEIISTEKINDKPELVSARNIFQKSNQPKLTKEDLEKMLKDNSVSTQNPKGDHSLMVGCLIGAGLILAFGIMIMRLVRRNKNKKNK